MPLTAFTNVFAGNPLDRSSYNRANADWVAEKIAVERKDLGSVNPVLAHAVEARMLGRPVLIDPLIVPVQVPGGSSLLLCSRMWAR